jgi:hypothetical protein
MESHAQSADNILLEGLSFKLPPTADYVTNRRSVTFMPQGGNEYSTTGVKVIKVNLTGNEWLDPSTVRFMFTINNTNATTANMLRVLGGPWSFFRRVRILAGNGTIVEDIDGYNRVHEMFHILTNPVNRENDCVEAGCSEQYDIIRNATYTDWGSRLNKENFLGINGNDSRTVCFRPLSGLLTQDKFIPLQYCPLQFEFELISNEHDVVVYPALTTNVARTTALTDVLDTAASTGYVFGSLKKDDLNFAKDNCSNSWKITNVQMKCDLIQLDSGLQNEYAAHLLASNSLPINYSTFITQKQIVNGPDYSTSITRSLSRLKSVFLTFSGTNLGDSVSNTPASGIEMRKNWNDFYHPSYKGDITYTNNKILLSRDEIEIQLQLGSRYYPEYPIKSVAESFYQLRKTLGITGSSWHGINIRPDEYRNCKYIVGIDTEKMLDVGFSGVSTKAGDLMNIRLKQPGVNATDLINMVYITLHSDQVLEIRDSGCQVMD